ncbi:YqzL-like protein [Melghirimyces thermohalophilus]|uniref:YqzL-like protein n=1 Tax=Melghirimyces thermohalophilus TaxID=1236220 RepID=A0A1G6P358_9BACL|nr:YqzL-like protein [Melghirimyces thermohalophilus]
MSWLRDFSWNCFAVTGSIDAYLLYTDMKTKTLAEWKDQRQPQKQKEETKV